MNRQNDLKLALKSTLEWWKENGVKIPDIKSSKQKPVNTDNTGKNKKTGNKTAFTKQNETKLSDKIILATELAKSAPNLQGLKQIIENFDAGILSDHARRAVFARGNAKSKIMLIGEAPGLEEDKSGKPFVGPAGQLLDKMLKSIGLDEQSVYITNICNWRPPGNRNPTEDELLMCKPFILRHIELIAPKIIIIAGGVSLQALTGKTGIMKTRGQWQEIPLAGNYIPAMPLYHPAFLLRRAELKKHAWLDLLAIKAKLSEFV